MKTITLIASDAFNATDGYVLKLLELDKFPDGVARPAPNVWLIDVDSNEALNFMLELTVRCTNPGVGPYGRSFKAYSRVPAAVDPKTESAA